MAIRAFRGADGVEWQVWCVIPGSGHENERRCGYDRRSPDPVIRYKGQERRTQAERRQALTFSPTLQSGWLVFDNGSERRRLAPIPPAWEQRSDADLDRLGSRALSVARVVDA